MDQRKRNFLGIILPWIKEKEISLRTSFLGSRKKNSLRTSFLGSRKRNSFLGLRKRNPPLHKNHLILMKRGNFISYYENRIGIIADLILFSFSFQFQFWNLHFLSRFYLRTSVNGLHIAFHARTQIEFTQSR